MVPVSDTRATNETPFESRPDCLAQECPGFDAGLKDLRDLVGVLSINAGSENNSDNLTQNFTVGTANVNLRGLGVASTLVLLNGRS